MKKKSKTPEIFKGVHVSVLMTDEEKRRKYVDKLSDLGCKVQSSKEAEHLVLQTSRDPAKVLILEGKSFDAYQQVKEAYPIESERMGTEFIVLGEENEAEKGYKCAQQLEGFFACEPVTDEELILLIKRALEAQLLKARLARYETPNTAVERFGQMVVKSPEMKDVIRLGNILAAREDCLLIVGSIGTGKELLARTIHEHSNRRHAPFYSVNCKSFVHEDLAIELFGKGEPESSEDVNLLEKACGGTLLLNEVGSISPNVQGKLQRFLEDGCYTRVNSRTLCQADVRILAATSEMLDESVAKGDFSEDLYFRLNRFTLHLPPLRRRTEDIPILVKHLLERSAKDKGEEVPKFSEAALKTLMEYQWPGNVRELENVLDFAMLVSGNEVIEAKHLPKQFHDEVGSIFVGNSLEDLPPMREIERRYILRVMEATRGNKVKAAEILDINRATLHRKLQNYEKDKMATLE